MLSVFLCPPKNQPAPAKETRRRKLLIFPKCFHQASCERKLVERFWKRVKKEAKGEADSLKITIKEEIRLIRETKKIINELEVVKRVLDDQLQVIIQASHRVRLEDELQGEVIRMSMVEINSRRVDDLLKSADEVTKNVSPLHNLVDFFFSKRKVTAISKRDS